MFAKVPTSSVQTGIGPCIHGCWIGLLIDFRHRALNGFIGVRGRSVSGLVRRDVNLVASLGRRSVLRALMRVSSVWVSDCRTFIAETCISSLLAMILLLLYCF